MKLTVIIVNYNVKYYVEQCLRSLERALEGIEAEVVVVDNHSKDSSVEYLKERFPKVRIIVSQHNQGFAWANNIAIRKSQSDYVLLLNPDTIVGEGTIRMCTDFMDSHERAGGIGVMMLKSNGEKARESRRGLPTPMTSLYKMTGLCDRFPESRRFGKYYMGYLPWDEKVQIEVISGAFCMLRRKAIDEVGMLDEDFFMYGEDIDLSYRLLKGGWENWYMPAKIVHYKGESTQKSSFRYVHVFYEAMLIFFRKHYSAASLWLTIPIKMAIYAKATVALAGMLSDKVRSMLGFFAGKKMVATEYLFMGSKEMLEECRLMADQNGLVARFVEASAETMPQGHMAVDMPLEKERLYVVYDTEAYGYQQIMDIFASEPKPNVEMATYDRHTRKMITAENVTVA